MVLYPLFYPILSELIFVSALLHQGWRRICILGGKFLSIFDVDNPRLGIRLCEASGSHSVIRLPRNESLRILPQTSMMKLFNALVACEERGDSRRTFGDDNSGGAPMYSCVGVQASRFGGIVQCSPCFASLSNEHWMIYYTQCIHER